MAVHLATNADYLQRTTALLPHAGDSTVCLWVKFVTVAVSPLYQTGYIIIDDPGTYIDYVAIYGETVDLRLDGNMTPVTTTAPVADTWYHVAWTQTGTTQKFYVNGTLIGSSTYNRTAVVTGFELLGSDSLDSGNTTVAYCREWTSALSQAQIRVEMASTVAVLSTGLYMDCPLVSDLLDDSGLSHGWTQVGAGSFVAGPTLFSNAAITTATAISTLPFSETLKMTGNTGTNPHVWYSYTAVAGDVVIGTWAFTSLASPNKPSVTVWIGPDTAPTHLTDTVDLNNATNVPYSVPITPGTQYFFEIINAGLDVAATADLTFSAVHQPILTITRGDLLVNDETFGFPMAALDAGSGAVKRHKVFSAGESVDTQPDGTVLAEAVDINGTPIGLQIWDADFTLQQTIAYPANFHSEVFHIVTSFAGGWFISAKGADTSHTTVSKMFVDGSISQTWTLTHAASANTIGIGVAPDESVLYYAITGSAAKAVQAWDLVNDIALPDFVAGIANYNVLQDIVVLSDGTVIVGHKKTSATIDGNVHHYSAAGALLDTYAFGAVGINRMCRALDDPTSFWLWIYPIPSPTDGLDRFVNVVVADGSFAADFTVAQYERGNYAAAATATPTARFGPSFSCPMWVYPVTVTAVGEPVEYLIRRERSWPHISSEQFRQFFSLLQVDLYAGNGLTAGASGSPVQGEDPLLEVDWSDDGGHTWSSIHLVTTGKIGAYRHRAIVRRLGYSRDRVFRIACSDPAQFVIINGYVQAVLGAS